MTEKLYNISKISKIYQGKSCIFSEQVQKLNYDDLSGKLFFIPQIDNCTFVCEHAWFNIVKNTRHSLPCTYYHWRFYFSSLKRVSFSSICITHNFMDNLIISNQFSMKWIEFCCALFYFWNSELRWRGIKIATFAWFLLTMQKFLFWTLIFKQTSICRNGRTTLQWSNSLMVLKF